MSQPFDLLRIKYINFAPVFDVPERDTSIFIGIPSKKPLLLQIGPFLSFRDV